MDGVVKVVYIDMNLASDWLKIYLASDWLKILTLTVSPIATNQSHQFKAR